MSQLQITNAGLDYRNAVFAGDEVQNITHFVFANISAQDESAPIDPDTTIPENIVHSQTVNAVSRVDGNAVVISTVMGYEVGDFEYNWFGVIATKANNEQVLIAVVTTALQAKTKTVGNVVGNHSVKSVVWRSQNIADDLSITLSALPWQVQEGEFVSMAEFESYQKFITKPVLELKKRHNLTDSENYNAPLTADLTGNEWFSVRASNGQPVLKTADSAKYKRLADGAIDNQVTIVADDKNERVFVYNAIDNLWEF